MAATPFTSGPIPAGRPAAGVGGGLSVPAARYSSTPPPASATTPRIGPGSVMRVNSSSDSRMIGGSVMSGDTATFTPPAVPWRMLSASTSASSGPGATPAASPKITPDATNASTESILPEG